MIETDAELVHRYKHVKGLHADAQKRLQRLKLGSPLRMRRAQWAGSMLFNVLRCETEMRERGLPIGEGTDS